jgi:hypothetical protein
VSVNVSVNVDRKRTVAYRAKDQDKARVKIVRLRADVVRMLSERQVQKKVGPAVVHHRCSMVSSI